MAFPEKVRTQDGSGTNALGDGDKPISRRSSSESFHTNPWIGRRILGRPLFVTRDQIGRVVKPTGFFLCMCAILLLSCGFGLMFMTLWDLITKIPYFSLIGVGTYIGTNVFALCGGIVCFPCFWICWVIHDNRRNNVLLPMLIVLLCLGLVLLVISASLGFVFRCNLSFEKASNGSRIKLQNGLLRMHLLKTMSATIKEYDKNVNHKATWDYIQRRIRCCGIDNAQIWKSIRKEIPCSCRNPRTNYEFLHATGCLNAVAYLLSWEVGFLSGVTIVAIIIQVVTLVLVSYMYGRERWILQRVII